MGTSLTAVIKSALSRLLHVAVENFVERQGFGRHIWERIALVQDTMKLHIYANASGWWNEYIHRDFLQQHFGNRENMQEPVLLLLDEFSGHWTKETKAFAAAINVHLMPVPPGLTSVDEHVRRQDHTTRFKMKPPKDEDVCKWVRSAWDRMTPGTIQAGYKRTGITVDATDVIEALQDHLDTDIGELREDAEFDN